MSFANGTELLGSFKMDNDDTYVVLVKSGNQYITARMATLTDKEWYWGNYFPLTDTGFQRAFADFMTRAGKSQNPDL